MAGDTRMSDKPTPLSRHTSDDIGAMLEAGERVRECQRVLARTGATVVTEALNGDKLEDNWSHYPRGDVFDQQSGSQFYFHAHRDVTGEVGHFHTFLRTSDIGGGEVSAMHLVAISMNRLGQAQTLFTTNRWVTGESWQPAERVTEALPGFEIDHAAPSWPLNIWITSMLRLFRFEIDWLLCKRDIEIDSHVSSGRALEEVLNDRTLEICAALPISVDRRINLLRAEKARRDQG